MLTNPIYYAFLSVTVFTVLMCMSVYFDNFKMAYGVELGIAHYAERVIPSWKPYLPRGLHMPFNSIINLGYVIVGAAWCAVVSVMLRRNQMTWRDAFCFYVFNFSSCFYGPIQFLRIVTQFLKFGVLDQWYTLPLFMWVFIWGLYFRYGWNSSRAFALTVMSIVSYISVLYYRFGFEICLGVHIVLALTGAVLAWTRHPQAKVNEPFCKALLSCLGFVGFKLLDHKLLRYHYIFNYISGHFISKIFDVGQIFYSNMFFLAITVAANKDAKEKRK